MNEERPDGASIPEPPQGPPEDDLQKAYYQAELDLHAAKGALDREKDKLEAETEWALVRAFHEALVDVAKTSIGGANARAESVRTAAGAIAVIYTGVLGLTFSVSDNPLPLRGVIPAVFLGLSMVMATAYIAYPVEPVADTEWPQAGRSSTQENQEERTTAFIKWAAGTVRTGEYALRAAVIALGFGVLFLPVAFLSLGSTSVGQELAAVSPNWPEAPTGLDDPNLRSLLYEAQVAEIAAQRQDAVSTPPFESWSDWAVRALYIAALMALGVSFLQPLVSRRRSAERLKQEATS